MRYSDYFYGAAAADWLKRKLSVEETDAGLSLVL